MNPAATPRHEAAHAVVAAALGVHVERVTAEPDAETWGRCQVNAAELLECAGYGEEGARWVRAHLMVSAAGAASEGGAVDWDAPHLGGDRDTMHGRPGARHLHPAGLGSATWDRSSPVRFAAPGCCCTATAPASSIWPRFWSAGR